MRRVDPEFAWTCQTLFRGVFWVDEISHSNALQSLRRRPYTPCHPQSFFSWAIPLTVGCCSSCWWAFLRFMVPCLSTHVPSIFVQSGLINWCHLPRAIPKLHVHRVSGHVILSIKTSGKCWAFAFVHGMSHARFVHNNCLLRLARHGMISIMADGCLEAYCCWSPSLADELGSRHNGACNRGLHCEWSSGKHTPSWDPSVASRHVSP